MVKKCNHLNLFNYSLFLILSIYYFFGDLEGLETLLCKVPIEKVINDLENPIEKPPNSPNPP
jgi:hypothetical protein